MSSLRELTFGQLGQLFDGPHATPKRVSKGPYFLNIASLSQGRLDLSLSDHVTPSDFERWTRRVVPQEDDLLFSYETRLGEAALMPSGIDACLGRRMALLRPNRSVVDPRFLLYWYLGPEFQRTIEQHTIHGATVTRIPLSTMANWPVRIPELAVQQAIAEVLGTLDDKIAANTRLVRTIDDLTYAEFRVLQHSATLSSTIGDMLTLEYGKSLPAAQRVPGHVAVYGSGGIVGNHNASLRDGPGVVVGRKGTAGTVHWAAGPHFPIDTTFYAVPNPKHATDIYCYFALKSLPLSEMNSDSAVPGLNRSEAHALPLRVPSMDMIVEFSDRANALFDLKSQHERENQSLAATRDALLPELMSGRLRVKDAERIVSDRGRA